MKIRARYIRFRSFLKLRYSRHFRQWLEAQGDRLGITAQEVFEDLMVGQGMSAQQVEAMPTPEEPEEP